jgi:FkbM family methyltransferase
MNERLTRKAWDWVRPLHSPITRNLRRRLGRNYFDHPEMELPPPYEAIQLDVERHLHQYLHVRPDQISQIVIVGAHEADEVDRFHRVYPKARFLCFEPNPPTHQHLAQKFARSAYVRLSDLALSDQPGTAQFFELDTPGNGSLLEPDVESWSRFNQRAGNEVKSFQVQVSTLDRELAGTPIDLLWMDVQGGEGKILAGGPKTLERTKAIFLEVAMVKSPYKGAWLFHEINRLLESSGFLCTGLGLDGWNGTGNAFFVRDLPSLICR